MHQAAVEAFAEKRALRLIRSAARRIPPHLGFLRVQRWRNAERARLEAEVEVRQMWEAAAAIAPPGELGLGLGVSLTLTRQPHPYP